MEKKRNVSIQKPQGTWNFMNRICVAKPTAALWGLGSIQLYWTFMPDGLIFEPFA
jgi:hypothetical protein